METTFEYIEFKKEEIPVRKKVNIDGILYSLEIQYNEIGDFYTAILFDKNEAPLIASKLVYIGNVFHANTPGVPSKKLMPLNIQDLAASYPEDLRVNSNTFTEKIGLYLV